MKYLSILKLKKKVLPAKPIKTANPKQAKNATITATNSRLCIEYKRMFTDLEKKKIVSTYITFFLVLLSKY